MDTDVCGYQKVGTWPYIFLLAATVLIFYEALTGIALYWMPMGRDIKSEVLLHAGLGALLILPLSGFVARHWRTHHVLGTPFVRAFGYTGALGALGIAISGPILTYQALLLPETTLIWDLAHMISVGIFITAIPSHLVTMALHQKKNTGKSVQDFTADRQQ